MYDFVIVAISYNMNCIEIALCFSSEVAIFGQLHHFLSTMLIILPGTTMTLATVKPSIHLAD